MMTPQIALGFGDNIDYEIVWDSAVMEELIVRYAITEGELSTDTVITCERDLVVSILAFLKRGVGGERFVASSTLIEEFAQHFRKKITLGGTPVRAAVAMRKLGYISALHLVTVNDHVRRLIPQDSPYVCSNTQETLYPHLIVQFPQGTRVQAGDIHICTGRANRIIYHNDVDNITMALNRDFTRLITDARVLLISGFNAMQSEALFVDRLQTVAEMLQTLPQGAVVFCEDAGFYAPAFSRLLYRTLAERINIVSMNEDELEGYLGRGVDPLSPASVLAALADLRGLIAAPVLVVHTMYWALAYGDDAGRFAQALRGGVTMATTRFRHGDDFTAAEYRAIETRPPHPEGARFALTLQTLGGDKICCVPVPQVAQENATTVGLGDAFVGGFLPALLA